MPDDSTQRLARLADLGLMATSLVHEMRQPLVAVKALSQLIHEDPASALEHADGIVRQAIVLETLLNRVRSYARGGVVAKSDSRADVRAAMDAVEALLRGMARTSYVRMEWTLPVELPPVAIDETSLQQILLNLVRNAIECPRAAAPGHVWLSASAVDGCVVLTVEDDGPGIAAAVRTTLFEPMRTTKADGLGLGLYISRTLAEQRAGRLDEDSVPGKGARFRLTLPVGKPLGE